MEAEETILARVRLLSCSARGPDGGEAPRGGDVLGGWGSAAAGGEDTEREEEEEEAGGEVGGGGGWREGDASTLQEA